MSYYVVGAFARDILLENIFNTPTGIATQDIDVAIQVNKWEDYQVLLEGLKRQYRYTVGKNSCELISPENVHTDLLPYGAIEQNRSISFPPKFDRVINMMGFQEIHDAAIEVYLDGKIPFKVASLEGLVILKFIAWQDLKPAMISQKHTRDIGLIIDAYFDAMVANFASEFADLFDEPDFDSTVCGAAALGRRIRQLCHSSNELTNEIHQLFSKILEKEENSLFISQLTATSNHRYAYSLRIVKALIKGFVEY
ncbi:MAG: hypothetical protein AAF806_29965 [Bacteroidota bacterium]